MNNSTNDFQDRECLSTRIHFTNLISSLSFISRKFSDLNNSEISTNILYLKNKSNKSHINQGLDTKENNTSYDPNNFFELEICKEGNIGNFLSCDENIINNSNSTSQNFEFKNYQENPENSLSKYSENFNLSKKKTFLVNKLLLFGHPNHQEAYYQYLKPQNLCSLFICLSSVSFLPFLIYDY